MPHGTIAVAVGVAVTAVASFAFLVLTARALGPTEYGALSVLWSAVYVISGLFLPLEQVVSREVAARIARGVGTMPLIRRAGILGFTAAALLLAGLLVVSPEFTDVLLRGEPLLVVSLASAIAAVPAARLLGGVLAGSGRFGLYGTYLGSEAVLRLVVSGALVLAGVTGAVPYGIVLALAPLVVMVPILRRMGRPTRHGPEASWRRLSVTLAVLAAGALFSSALLYAAPILLEALTAPSQKIEVGVFNAALVLARLPIILFAPISIALLPQLSTLAAHGGYARIARTVRSVLAITIGLGMLGMLLAVAIGSDLMVTVYGGPYRMEPQMLGMLLAGSGAYVAAMAVAQGLIAVRATTRIAWSWAAGLAAMIVTAVLLPDLETMARVTTAYVVGSFVAAVCMTLLLERVLRLRQSLV